MKKTRQEEREETLFSVHTKVRDFVGREMGGDRQGLLVRAAQYYERRARASGILWDLLRARDYYYRAEEWETAADIVIAAWEYLARWGYNELAMGLLKQSADTNFSTKKVSSKNKRSLNVVSHNVPGCSSCSSIIATPIRADWKLAEEEQLVLCGVFGFEHNPPRHPTGIEQRRLFKGCRPIVQLVYLLQCILLR